MPVEFRFGSLEISKNMLLWINDALMAVFFLMMGLEVKHELVQDRWQRVNVRCSHYCRDGRYGGTCVDLSGD